MKNAAGAPVSLAALLIADGRLGVVAEYHPKNLVPLAHLEHGGAFEDTITVFGADVGNTAEAPLDELERYVSLPFDVAIAPDKSRIYVTSGGLAIVTVVDVPRLMRFIHLHPATCDGRQPRGFNNQAGWPEARLLRTRYWTLRFA
jgi:hypothetical protein